MIDLHLHTNYSDGTDTVKELLVNAENNNLEIISITDHDSIDSYYELENSEIRNLFKGKIIVGTELKTYYDGVPIEVLGYGIDYKKIKINKVDIYDIQVKQLEDLKEVARKLGLKFDENISVSKTDPTKRFASYVFATEILKYEDNNEILLNVGPMFDANSFYRVHTSNKDSIFYYDESKNSIPIEEVIKSIHEVGGVAVLAHPLLYPFDDKFSEIEKIITKYDIDGIECEYPLFSIDERNSLKQLALKYNKIVTGGTDYHAQNKPNIMIGTGIDNNMNINTDYIKGLLNKINTI